MNSKLNAVEKFWSDATPKKIDYSQIDPATLKLFSGTHPKIVQEWLPPAEDVFQPDPNYRLTSREKKHRLMLKLEKWFGFRFNKKHYTLISK
jgi:hypothetical protein